MATTRRRSVSNGSPRLPSAATCTAKACSSSSSCPWRFSSIAPTMTSGRPTSSTATADASRDERSSLARTSGVALESEPDAAHGGDEPRLPGVVAELAAQPRHVHVEGLGGAVPVRVPHLAHDLLARDDAAGLAYQQPEQVELLGRQVQLDVVQEGPPRLDVDPHPRGD